MLEFLPMLKEDRITKEINELLRKVEKDSKSTEYKQKVTQICAELKHIYEKAKIDELIERKNYIENCMDNPYNIFITLALSTISWYFVEIISAIINLSPLPAFIISILKILVTAILAISAYTLFSAKMSKQSRLYLKFNLKNVELESIDLILTHEIEYKKYIDDISKNYIYNYHNDTMLDKKRKRRTGFPKFKSAKRSRKSYTTNNQKGTIAIIDCKHIKLLKIGNLTLPTAKGKGRVK